MSIKRLFAFAFFHAIIYAALPAATTWEIRPTNGSNNNGGGFVTGSTGTDFSQQNAAQYTFSDLASANGTTNPCVVSSVSHSFVAADVGNLIHITAGTNWTAGYYELVSVAAGAATLDRACGTAAALTSGTYFVGGAIQTLAQFSSNAVNGNSGYVKAESTITTASAISIVTAASGSVTAALIGYTSTRTDQGQATVQATGAFSNPIITLTGTNFGMQNFIFDCNSQTGVTGMEFGNNDIFGRNLTAINCLENGIYMPGTANMCSHCTVTGVSGTLTSGFLLAGTAGICIDCVATGIDTTGSGISFTGAEGACIRCIAGNNTGHGGAQKGISVTSNQFTCSNCVTYGNGGDGMYFDCTSICTLTLENLISYGNTGCGINFQIVSGPAITENNNSYGGNTGGNLCGNATAGANDVILTADPFVAGASNNFALNSTSGGGASVKAKGFPGVLNVGGTGFLDMGALQTQAPAAAGTVGFPLVQ